MIYLFAFIVLLIPVLRFDLMQLDGNKKSWFYVEYVLLVLISGLRYRVGGDTLFYMDFFEEYPTIRELATFDFEMARYNPCWYVYNSVFKTFGDSFTLYQICQAAIVNLVFFRFFRRYSPVAFFSCILVYYFGYYCYFNMEIQREILCICIFLEAYPFLEKKKLLPYYLLCIVALFFHMSALILFFFPLALLIKKDNFWMAIVIMFIVFCALHVMDVVSFLISISFEGKIATSIDAYMKREMPNIIGMIVLMLIAFPFVLLMYVRSHWNFDNDKLMGALLLFLIAIQTAATFVGIISRFSNYLVPIGIVFIVNTFYVNFWEIRKRDLSCLLVAGAIVVYTFNMTYYYFKKQDDFMQGAHTYDIYFPYYSVFNPQKDSKREMFMMNRAADDV